MPRWAIVADDLTGALDTAVQFRKAGYQTLVSAQDGSWPPDATVVAMSTASRHLESLYAHRSITYATDKSRIAPSTRIYKKTDSLLRGNIGQELQALLESTGTPTMVYTPAFPSGGRTTEDGVLTLWGTPVAKAAPGRDRVTPARESHIPTLIESTSDLTCQVIGREVIRAGSDLLAETFTKSRDRGVHVIVPDIGDDAELDAVAAAMASANLLRVSGGSAGLARSLAQSDESTSDPAFEVRKTSNIVSIIGTPMEHTQQQVLHAADAIPLDQITLGSATANLATVISAIHAAWASGRVALVDAVIKSAAPTARQQDDQEMLVANFTGELLRTSPIFGLVVSGGDTARAAFSGIGSGAIELAGEIGWGVPYGAFSFGGPAAGYPLATKAGIMGSLTALPDAFRIIGRFSS